MSNIYRDDFWNFYVSVGHASAYFHRYLLGCKRASRFLDIFTVVTSASSIAGWAIWDQYKTLWAIIIGVSQIVSVISPYLPSPKRASVLGVVSPMVDDIFNDAKLFWTAIDSQTSDETIRTLIALEKRYDLLDKAITTSIDLPPKQRYDKFAENENKRYFASRYGVHT